MYRPGVTVILTFLSLILRDAPAQDIPLGTWRMHISYQAITGIAPGAGKMYGAAENGLMALDLADNSITTHSKLTGLTGSSISYIGFDSPTGTLLIAYTDGNLDLIKNNTITNFDRLKDASVTVSKAIHHILFYEGLAYLSTDYGVVVFDLDRQEVKETWRDLGDGGGQAAVAQGTVLGDSIFLATENGVLAGHLGDNLLDYANWKRFNEDELNTAVKAITTFNGKIYIAIDNDGLYHYEAGTWTKESILEEGVFHSLSGSAAHLVVTREDQVWKLSSAGALTGVASALIVSPRFALEDAGGHIWIGDRANGLVSDAPGAFVNYLPNGPAFPAAVRLKYFNNKMYALPGGHSEALAALNNEGRISYFSDGKWSTENTAVRDVTDIDFVNNEPYVASFGMGVQQGTISAPATVYNEGNSTLININPPGDFINITAIEDSGDGLWVANYGASAPLHVLKPDNTWQAFSFGFASAQYPVELAVDYYGSVWALLNAEAGGGILVYNRYNNESVRLTEEADAGGLPNRNALSVALDRNGYIWVGTEDGVAYFVSPSNVFVSGTNAIRPIFENQYLLNDEEVTAIAVDGGDRKWIGTTHGAWLFGPTGEELVHNFTEDNSPLLSDVINDIEIDPKTGEVFFATARGIVSFRSDATGGSGFEMVKVFPNPVTAGFSGTVGISGLATDAEVKITDISGKMIWQTRANGSTATWNVHDYRGRRAATGIYLIFATTRDGNESFVGKIAVVE